MTLTLLKRTGQFFCRILHRGFVWCFLVVNLRLCSFDNHGGAAVLCDIRRYMYVSMPHCWWRGLHHVVKVVFARFLGKATIFLLVNNKYLVGRNFETMLTFCFLYLDSQILVSIGDACLWQLWLANGDFLFPSSLLHLFIGILLWGRAFLSFPFIYFTNYLYQYGFVKFCSMGYNPLLLFYYPYCPQIWPLEAPSSWHPMYFGQASIIFLFFLSTSSEDTPDSAASCSSLVMLSTISPKTLGFFNWRRVFWNWDCGCKVYTFYWVFEESFDDSMEIGNESWLSQSLGKHPGFHEELRIDHIWMRLQTSSRDQHPHWVLTQVKPAC